MDITITVSIDTTADLVDADLQANLEAAVRDAIDAYNKAHGPGAQPPVPVVEDVGPVIDSYKTAVSIPQKADIQPQPEPVQLAQPDQAQP